MLFVVDALNLSLSDREELEAALSIRAEYIAGDWELGVPLALTHVSFDATYDSLKKWDSHAEKVGQRRHVQIAGG